MEISLDSQIYWQWGPIVINATLVYTWIVMGLLTVGSWLITRRLKTEPKGSYFQVMLEAIVTYLRTQIQETVGEKANRYLPFIGTLFLFIAVSNVLGVIPFYESPMGSLSTTVALALCVFFAVPLYGIMAEGLKNYLKHYIEPTPIMLPFHIISEISRTVSLAVRLFGNVMSGSLLVGIIVSVIPLFVPVVLQGLELLVGVIQAYIFAVLAMVYIASSAETQEEGEES